MNKSFFSAGGILLAAILFFAVNLLANTSLRSMRVDMTEKNLYTLTEGSKAIARDLDQEINLYYYFSKSATEEIPQVANYGERVRGILREYERISDGRINLTEINPEPFSEEEDRAVQEGVKGVPITETDQLYFGLVGTNEVGDREVHPFFEPNPAKERFLEYDISRLIWTLAHPDKKKVGLLTQLAIEGGPPAGGNPFQQQQGTPPWQVLPELRQFFDAEVIDPSSGELDFSELDVLAVVHPRGFSQDALYAIDQWALAGKPLLVFVDPHCEADPGDADPTNQFAQFQADRGSNLDLLFAKWGIEMAAQKFVGDRDRALAFPVDQSGQRIPIVQYISLEKDDLDETDPVTSLLEKVIFAASGSLRKVADGTTEFHPLVQTTEQSAEIDVGRIKFPNYKELFTNFVAGHERLTLAARVTGDVQTAFPDGPPGGSPEDASASDEAGLAEASASGDHLVASAAPLNAIVVADADLLQDRWWISIRDTGLGFAIRQQLADNGDFVRNAIENLAGGKDLISIRARGEYSRPFTKVEEIERFAEQRYRAEQEELERTRRDIERKLNELEGQRTEGTDQLVTEAQVAQQDQWRDELVETRRKLRDVQHGLRADVEALGTKVKVLNTFLLPAATGLFALGLFLVRSRQRRAKR